MTAACFRVREPSVFRPKYTFFPALDKTSRNAAENFSSFVKSYGNEVMDHADVMGLIALVSLNCRHNRKVAIVNIAIKWLAVRTVNTAKLHVLLMSISTKFPFQVAAKVRVAIHIYLTTPQLNRYHDICLFRNGTIYIQRKTGIPGDPPKFDDDDEIVLCKSLNAITDSYPNPYWPQGTKRRDPEKPVFEKGKWRFRSGIATVRNLANPIFQWNFKNRGAPYEQKDPVVPDMFTEPAVPSHSECVSYGSLDEIENEKTVNEEAGTFSVDEFSFLSDDHKRTIQKRSTATNTTSSGYCSSPDSVSDVSEQEKSPDRLTRNPLRRMATPQKYRSASAVQGFRVFIEAQFRRSTAIKMIWTRYINIDFLLRIHIAR